MKTKVSDEKLKSIVASHIKASLGYETDELSQQRRDNLERYEGEPYGNERLGHSQVMSRDVMETVEAVMPSLVRTFLGTDEVVKFEPEGPEDEEYAQQATDYVNLVLMRDNPGFQTAVDWMKSALITRTSMVKLWWDETDTVRTEVYGELTDPEFTELVQDNDVEVLEHTAYARVDGQLVEPDQALAVAGLGAQIEAVHEVKIKRKTTKARLKWMAVPPNEMLVNRRARSLDENDHTWQFACHRQRRSIEGLLAEGYDQDILERTAKSESDDDYHDEEIERYDDLDFSEGYPTEESELQKRIWVFECYLRADCDGDGVSELRRVTVIGGGTNTEILENEPADELPFADLTAIRLPYRLVGWSMADLVKDIQALKTAIWRAMMDGLYLSLYPHKAVNGDKVDLDDLLSEEPGSIYVTDGPPGDAIMPIQTAWPGQQAFPMLEYVDRVLASRSGVNDLAGGLDGNVLQGETARGVEEAANSARARIELIARTFAETGWTRAVKLALKMLNRHQDRERVVRLRKKWVPIDPRSWNVDMDVRINVAMGVGTKNEQIQKTGMIAAKQEAVMAQMGPTNPLASLEKYYVTLRKMAEAMDLDPDAHFEDPGEWVEQQRIQQATQPPPPNPEIVKAEMERALKQEENEMKGAQAERQAQLDAANDHMRIEGDKEVAREKIALESAASERALVLQAEVDRVIGLEKIAAQERADERKHQLNMTRLAMEERLEREKIAAKSRDGNANIPNDGG